MNEDVKNVLSDHEVDQKINDEMERKLTEDEQLAIDIEKAKDAVEPDPSLKKPVLTRTVVDPISMMPIGAQQVVDDIPYEDLEPEVKEVIDKYNINPDSVFEDLMTLNSVTEKQVAAALEDTIFQVNELSQEDLTKLTEVVNDYLSKIPCNYYDKLPIKVKEQLDIEAAKAGATLQESKQLKNSIAKELVEEITNTIIISSDNFDISSVIGKIKEVGDEAQSDINAAQASIRIVQTTSVIKDYETKIKEAEEAGDLERAEKLRSSEAYNALLETMDLGDFKEFCKKVKIKKFDLEKPNKIFRDFNNKYYNHKLMIHDISVCPEILKVHLKNHIDDMGYLKVLIAFCKYATNMNPNNTRDHLLMYWFVENIWMMQVIAPKGLIITTEIRTQNMIDYYLTCIRNLEEAINNMKK